MASQFHGGDDEDDADHLQSIYMFARLCDLSLADEYFCYMQKLLIRAGKASDPTYLKHYLRSFPGHVPDAVEKYMKDKNLNYQNLSIAQLHHHIKETWQEHCLAKRIDKDFKRHQNMYTPLFCKKVAELPDWGCGAHNRGHLNCH